jgi:hypothetical protein
MGVEEQVVKNKESGCNYLFCIPLFFSLFYQRKHRPLEELIAGADEGKPFSQPGRPSACCSCIVTATVTIMSPPSTAAAGPGPIMQILSSFEARG